jgi:hypothetical protein
MMESSSGQNRENEGCVSQQEWSTETEGKPRRGQRPMSGTATISLARKIKLGVNRYRIGQDKAKIKRELNQ